MSRISGWRVSSSVSSSRFFSHCESCPEEVDDARRVHVADVRQRSEVDVESFPVVVGPEVVGAGVGNRPGVQRIRDKRAVGRQRRHHAVVPRRWATRPTGRAVGEGG